MQAASYRIPVDNLRLLDSKIAQINKRIDKHGLDCDKFTVKPLHTVYLSRWGEAAEEDEALIGWIWVTITGGTPKYDGWELCGRYDHGDRGATILHDVPGVDSVPRKYWSSSEPRCDHCGKQRHRSATFLLRKGRRYKIVGRTCLRDFLGHPDVADIANMFSWVRDIDELAGEFSDASGERIVEYASVHRDMEWICGIVRNYGWLGAQRARELEYEGQDVESTAQRLNFITGRRPTHSRVAAMWEAERQRCRPTEQDVADAREVFALIEASSDRDEYTFKLKMLANNPDGVLAYRDRSLWASAITLLIRERRIKAERKARKASPVVEGRQTIEGRVLATKLHDSNFGSVLRMTVQAPSGQRYWGSVPSGLDNVQRKDSDEWGVRPGDVVRFKGTVAPSDDDPTFGFFKRPSNAEMIEEATACSA